MKNIIEYSLIDSLIDIRVERKLFSFKTFNIVQSIKFQGFRIRFLSKFHRLKLFRVNTFNILF